MNESKIHVSGRIDPALASTRRTVNRTLLATSLLAFGLTLGSVTASAQSVCDAYATARFEQAVRIAQEVLAADTETDTRIDIYRCKAAAHFALAQDTPAKLSIGQMLHLDAGARFSPDTRYSPALLELYHSVRDSLFPGVVDVNTIAIGDFEDNSIYQGKYKDYDFSLFEKALVHTITADLGEATSLKLVDRQRVDKITREIELNQSGFANPEQAVKAGELLGAQSFIFGQYMILSKDMVRIDARLVHTATGQIIMTKQVTGNFGGDPMKFLELEQELVTALAAGIDDVLELHDIRSNLDSQVEEYFGVKRSSMKDRDGYVESQFLVAQAFDFEDAGNFKDARTTWEEVLEVDPPNDVAPIRIRVLDSIING